MQCMESVSGVEGWILCNIVPRTLSDPDGSSSKRIFKMCIRDSHGAEHKTIFCYENDLPLTVENVKPQKRLHPRCGTSYLLLVMVLSTVIYSCFPWGNSLLLRMATKLLLLPIIAGVSYEMLKLLAKGNHILVRALRWPGIQLQRLTTAEPDEDMIQVAIVAFEAALGEKNPEEVEQLRRDFSIDNSVQVQQAEEQEKMRGNEKQD